MSKTFKNRVFGTCIVKSINSNFNADFSHQPRTLPDGIVYATDKALKYTIRNFLKQNYKDDKILYFKSFDKDAKPRSLEESYLNIFNKVGSKNEVLSNLLSCIDVRLFGATFAMKAQKGDNINLSVYGPLQINHGVNRFPENEIYSEQILSPFADKKADKDKKDGDGPDASTLGRQSKLKEGHYVFHFSINPINLQTSLDILNGEHSGLTEDDIKKLKETMRGGATLLDSSAKAGSENELLFWITLQENSKLVLPNFTSKLKIEKVDGSEKRSIDFDEVTKFLSKDHVKQEIENIELYYNKEFLDVNSLPSNAKIEHL